MSTKARVSSDGSTEGPFRPGRLLLRGMIRHCPRCNSGHLFRHWFVMVERCPGCDYKFDREEGSSLGAYVVNFGITEGALAILMVIFIIRLASDESGGGSIVPWLIVGVTLAIVVPAIFYPFSKTIWTAIDLIMHKGRPGPTRAADQGAAAG